MSLLTQGFKEHFRHVAEQFNDRELLFEVELKALRQALEPVLELMVNYDVHHNDHEISVDSQLKYLRQTCLDLQLARTDIDSETKEKQNVLLGSLHAVMEDVRDAQGGVVMVNHEDLFRLSQLSDIIRSDADICNNEMKRELGDVVSSDLHDMLNKTANRFDSAQSRAWEYKAAQPSIDLDAVASNDAEHDQLSCA